MPTIADLTCLDPASPTVLTGWRLMIQPADWMYMHSVRVAGGYRHGYKHIITRAYAYAVVPDEAAR
jgi:hypothetical protein